MRGDRGDSGWRECERGGGTVDGGSVRGDRGDSGWRECERGQGGTVDGGSVRGEGGQWMEGV